VIVETSQRPPSDLATSLLVRVDENLACHAVNDNLDLPIDLSGALLFQTSEAIELQRRLDQLQADTASPAPAWLPSLQALSDALFRHLVETLALRPPEAGLTPPSHVTDVLARLADVVAAVGANDLAHSPTAAGRPAGTNTCASS
jgi:hypothetical protein